MLYLSVWRNRKGQDVDASISSVNLKEVLSIIETLINGKKCMAWFSRCSLDRCAVTGVSKSFDIMTADGEIFHRHGIGTITLATDNINPLKADVLVMNSLPIGFNMLIKMDVIKMLGRVSTNQSSEAISCRMDSWACTVIG